MTFSPQDHLIKLKGKDYLEVMWRVVWFREHEPQGRIATDVVSVDPLIIKATITNGDGLVLSTGHGSANAGGKSVVWSGREIEKAETAAIGRALAHAGYGTQFTAEDEGDYLADSPVARVPSPHWTTDAARVGKFKRWANDQVLTDMEVLQALGVSAVESYTGSDADAVSAINDFIERNLGKKNNNYTKEDA